MNESSTDPTELFVIESLVGDKQRLGLFVLPENEAREKAVRGETIRPAKASEIHEVLILDEDNQVLDRSYVSTAKWARKIAMGYEHDPDLRAILTHRDYIVVWAFDSNGKTILVDRCLRKRDAIAKANEAEKKGLYPVVLPGELGQPSLRQQSPAKELPTETSLEVVA